MNYFQFDSTKMDYSKNASSYDQNNNFTPVSQPPYLTRDQEHVIMVSALRQVISNFEGDTSSSNWNACEARLPPLNAGPCPLCSITGCYGCAFPRHEEIKKEKKHKGVRKKPSGKLYSNTRLFQQLWVCSNVEYVISVYGFSYTYHQVNGLRRYGIRVWKWENGLERFQQRRWQHMLTTMQRLSLTEKDQ